MMDFLKKDNEIPKESDRVIENMRMIAQAQDEAGNHKKAFEMYKAIVEIKEDGDAFFNLGVLYATGRGVRKDYLTASHYFKKACMLGDPDGGKMLVKAKYDYIAQVLENSDEESAYNTVMQYAKLIENEKDAREVTNGALLGYGNHLFNEGKYQKALKAYRVGAIYGEDGDCRHNIAMIYMNKSNQTEESMAAVFYWLDKAVTSGITNAKNKLEQIMSFAKNKGIDMSRVFGRIVVSCKDGSEDIPKDITKVAYWANVALNGMEK